MTVLVENLVKLGIGIVCGVAVGGTCYGFQVLANEDAAKKAEKLEKQRHENAIKELELAAKK